MLPLICRWYQTQERLPVRRVKEKLARGPSVFDPRKHIFDPNKNSVFIGASEEKIMSWIAGIDRQGRMSR
jgi:hypothetical protein